MLRPTFLLVLASGLVVSTLAACAGETEDDDLGASDDALTLLEFKCRSSASTFDINPATGGTSHEGKLDSGDIHTVFVCRPAPADAGPGAVATCTERPQQAHPGRWSFALTKRGSAYAGVLDKGGTTEAMTCQAPAPAADAGAVPTYAVAGPMITRACNGCHAGKYDTLPKVKQNKAAMLGVILSGAMPMRSRGWKDTPDGKTVIDFLKNSPELR